MKTHYKKFLALLMIFAMILQYSVSVSFLTVYAEGDENQTEAAQVEAKAEAKAAAEPAPAPEPKPEPKPAPEPEPEPKAEPAPELEKAAPPAEAKAAAAESAPDEEPAEEDVTESEPDEEAPADAAGESSEAGEGEDEDAAASEDAAEADVTDEEIEVVEGEEEAEEEEVKYPALSDSKTVDDMTVYVSAPEGAFPEGTTVSVASVSAEAITEDIKALKGEKAEVVKAVDISFHYKGREIEPKDGKKVSVRFRSSEIGQADSPSVVHIPDGGAAEPVSANISGSNAAFRSDEFSIYAVVDSGTTEDDARLTVNFVQSGGETVTIYVKKTDIGDNFNTIVYDPGAGTLESGQVFLGWTDNPNYNKDTTAQTIAGIRNAVKTKVNAGVAEGEAVTYYAMVFNLYKITFLNKSDSALGEDKVYVRADENSGAAVDYEISMGYTPQDLEHNFEGWNVSKGSSNIIGYTEGKLYQQEEEIQITGSVTFSVNESEGHWLVFDENGKGATYNAPVFVKSDEVTSEPTIEMTRNGYTFGGWYTGAPSATGEDPTGQQFTFGKKLTDYTTIYAKWIPAGTAGYTVIIWREKVTGGEYDFEESVQISDAQVNTTPTAVSGTPGNNVARINNRNYSWTGFYYDRTDQSDKTVSPEGNTVVNVYFKRKTITIDFYTTQSGICGIGRYNRLYKSISGLYGSPIDNWPSEYAWGDSPNAGGTVTVFMDAFLPPDGSDHMTFYGGNPQSSATIEFYKQKVDGSGYDLANTVYSRGGTFYITDKYSGFTAYQYSNDNGRTWHDVGPKDESTGEYGEGVPYNNKLMIRFNRNETHLTFLNGSYYSGNDTLSGPTSGGEAAPTVEHLLNGADISGYADTKPKISEPGYAFAGWYIDDACTQKYEFTTLPEDGAQVYAKWNAIQYRVFLHPNVPSSDTSLYWGSDSQSMTFRVDNGGKVSAPTGKRDGYEFIGWFFDESFSRQFNQSAFVLNDTTVTSGYNKNTDMTDPMDKWGNGATTNADTDRFWITKKLDLYAKWSATVEGAKGIGVKYDAAEGSGAPTDTNQYTDGADAIASTTPTPPSGKQFDYWVLQTWNGSAYEDTSTHLNPGDHFTVNKADAKQEIIEQDEDGKIIKATYTVQLKAVYVKADTETKTKITYKANGGSGDDVVEELGINASTTAKENPFTRTGYEFVEWNTMADGSGTSFQPGDTIAADLLNRTKNSNANILYAKWREKQKQTAKVTFKVVNGSWNDETSEDIEVTLEGYEGDELKLSEDDIPEVGGKPDTGYKEGAWDVTPSTSTVITGNDTVYTYTYETAPEPEPTKYNVTYRYTGSVPAGAPAVPVAKQYAEGDSVTVASAPTLAGYTFSGWSRNGSFTMPGEDVVITGSWTPIEPTPDDDDEVVDDDTPAPNPGGGGGNPGGGGPAAAPAAPLAPAAVIADEPVPQAEPEPEEIIDEPAPLAAPENPWALINLLCAALATVGAGVALFRKKEEEDEDDEPDPEDEDDNRGRNMAIAKGLGAAAAVASIVTFILTEDMSGPMQMVDQWTLLMAALFAGQVGTAVANKKASELEEEDDE